MKSLRIDIPPHVADVLRSLHPDLKRSLKAALRAIASDPHCGEPLLRKLAVLQKYRVRRFRIVYGIDRKSRVIQVMAIGPRRHIYEELAERLHRGRREQ
ncbi:MAG: type II toxin-antitoxin system RelE/ParE family toxin [Nitrospirales bacterium]